MKNKKKIMVAVIIMAACPFFVINLSPYAGANGSGAPSGNTGSPGDGSNCTSCHSGTASNQAGLITSTIPISGYVPGQTYTITGAITTTGKTKFGFQVSPQDVNGVLKGTMVVTNSTATQLINSGKYITHKFAGNAFPSGTATWSFDWTAPAAGTGDVTFYGGFNSSNSMSNTSGDLITLSSLTVSEDITTGISAINNNFNQLTVYPNPFTDKLYVNSSDENDKMEVSVIDINGKVLKRLNNVQNNQRLDLEDIANGYYVLSIKTADGLIIKKVTKK